MYQWNYISSGNRHLPTLVLLHGWMGSSGDYRQALDLLRDRFHCLAIDLPGHGKTEVMEDRGYEFVATAQGIVRLLDSLHLDRCLLAGYSFGGRLALYLALEYPERFDRVLLESTSPGLATSSEREARRARDALIIEQLQHLDFSTFVEQWYRQPIFHGIADTPDFANLLATRRTNQPDLLAKSLQYAGLAEQPYLGDRLTQYDRPILLLVGEHDQKFVTINHTIAQASPQATLKIISDCSHNIHYQQPHHWISIVRNWMRSTFG